ncbi:MAG TPA: TraR/DksA family transcriptional regulator [Myxococcales bacterium]|jgi:DnaK suppressor protein|nr:TraR/DksA family transcriptional regulator [Myxococcales bacterium]
MTPAQRAQVKKVLQEMESELAGKGPRKVDPNRSGDAPDVGTNEDEQPLNEMLQTIASNRNRADAATLLLVRRALDKLAAGGESFGECEECGEDISPGRLKAMPYAQLCVNCQAKRDGPRTLPTRKKLTDYT